MDKPSVLVVDDDRATLLICQRILQRYGFEVETFLSPREVLDQLRVKAADLLISDIRMPEMDGFEVIETAKTIQPDLAVIVMTGFGSVETAIQAVHKRADGIILKPFGNPEELQETVWKILTDFRKRQDAARVEVLRPLFDVTASIQAETNPEILHDQVLDAVIQIGNAQIGGIYFQDQNQPDQDELIIVRQQEVPEEQDPAWQEILALLINAPERVLCLNQHNPDHAEFNIFLERLGWDGLLSAVQTRGQRKYLILAARQAGMGTSTSADTELFGILTRQAVVAMDNTRLYTDLRESLRRIDESQRALIQAEKMAAVGRLMTSLAHEINNPLQSVRNCLHLATRAEVNPEQKDHYLNLTHTELDRLVKTIRQMLEFYRPGQKDKEYFQVDDVVSRVVQLLTPQLEKKKIQVMVNVPSNLLPVFALRDQLQQVLLNLLMNSMDAVAQTEEKWIRIDVECVDRVMKMRIEDSGHGIDPDLRSRLFEPFNTTKNQGTGLGLSISYGIVESMGGTLLNIPPSYGNGACFEIQIPLAEGEQ